MRDGVDESGATIATAKPALGQRRRWHQIRTLRSSGDAGVLNHPWRHRHAVVGDGIDRAITRHKHGIELRRQGRGQLQLELDVSRAQAAQSGRMDVLDAVDAGVAPQRHEPEP